MSDKGLELTVEQAPMNTDQVPSDSSVSLEIAEINPNPKPKNKSIKTTSHQELVENNNTFGSDVAARAVAVNKNRSRAQQVEVNTSQDQDSKQVTLAADKRRKKSKWGFLKDIISIRLALKEGTEEYEELAEAISEIASQGQELALSPESVKNLVNQIAEILETQSSSLQMGNRDATTHTEGLIESFIKELEVTSEYDEEKAKAGLRSLINDLAQQFVPHRGIEYFLSEKSLKVSSESEAFLLIEDLGFCIETEKRAGKHELAAMLHDVVFEKIIEVNDIIPFGGTKVFFGEMLETSLDRAKEELTQETATLEQSLRAWIKSYIIKNPDLTKISPSKAKKDYQNFIDRLRTNPTVAEQLDGAAQVIKDVFYSGIRLPMREAFKKLLEAKAQIAKGNISFVKLENLEHVKEVYEKSIKELKANPTLLEQFRLNRNLAESVFNRIVERPAQEELNLTQKQDKQKIEKIYETVQNAVHRIQIIDIILNSEKYTKHFQQNGFHPIYNIHESITGAQKEKLLEEQQKLQKTLDLYLGYSSELGIDHMSLLDRNPYLYNKESKDSLHTLEQEVKQHAQTWFANTIFQNVENVSELNKNMTEISALVREVELNTKNDKLSGFDLLNGIYQLGIDSYEKFLLFEIEYKRQFSKDISYILSTKFTSELENIGFDEMNIDRLTQAKILAEQSVEEFFLGDQAKYIKFQLDILEKAQFSKSINEIPVGIVKGIISLSKEDASSFLADFAKDSSQALDRIEALVGKDLRLLVEAKALSNTVLEKAVLIHILLGRNDASDFSKEIFSILEEALLNGELKDLQKVFKKQYGIDLVDQDSRWLKGSVHLSEETYWAKNINKINNGQKFLIEAALKGEHQTILKEQVFIQLGYRTENAANLLAINELAASVSLEERQAIYRQLYSKLTGKKLTGDISLKEALDKDNPIIKLLTKQALQDLDWAQTSIKLLLGKAMTQEEFVTYSKAKEIELSKIQSAGHELSNILSQKNYQTRSVRHNLSERASRNLINETISILRKYELTDNSVAIARVFAEYQAFSKKELGQNVELDQIIKTIINKDYRESIDKLFKGETIQATALFILSSSKDGKQVEDVWSLIESLSKEEIEKLNKAIKNKVFDIQSREVSRVAEEGGDYTWSGGLVEVLRKIENTWSGDASDLAYAMLDGKSLQAEVIRFKHNIYLNSDARLPNKDDQFVLNYIKNLADKAEEFGSAFKSFYGESIVELLTKGDKEKEVIFSANTVKLIKAYLTEDIDQILKTKVFSALGVYGEKGSLRDFNELTTKLSLSQKESLYRSAYALATADYESKDREISKDEFFVLQIAGENTPYRMQQAKIMLAFLKEEIPQENIQLLIDTEESAEGKVLTPEKLNSMFRIREEGRVRAERGQRSNLESAKQSYKDRDSGAWLFGRALSALSGTTKLLELSIEQNKDQLEHIEGLKALLEEARINSLSISGEMSKQSS